MCLASWLLCLRVPASTTEPAAAASKTSLLCCLASLLFDGLSSRPNVGVLRASWPQRLRPEAVTDRGPGKPLRPFLLARRRLTPWQATSGDFILKDVLAGILAEQDETHWKT